jgi:hypothetical protein
MRTCLYATLLVGTGFVFPGNCQPPAPTTTQQVGGPPVKLIPWVECNYPDAKLEPHAPDSPIYFEHVVEGLLTWNKVTDTVIVSTTPGQADLYPRLRERVPTMRIIPGLKTMDLLPRFDSASGWTRVAREVRRMQTLSGQDIILLENEWALAPYAKGEKSLNVNRLQTALRELPRDVEYWWYPPAVYWFAKKHGPDVGRAMCPAIQAALPRVRFVDQRFEAKAVVKQRGYVEAAKRFDAIVNRTPLAHVLFYGPDVDYTWWRDEDINEALACVYEAFGADGVKRWPEAARSLSHRLQSPASPQQP